MIKIYQNYLVKLFLSKILKTSLVFSLLVFILSVFEEINFFKDANVEFFFPFFLTALDVPSTLFIIFPFIFLISVQFLFLDLINKDELSIFKTHGLNNFKIIKILLFSSFIFGLFISLVFYGFSSKLKFIYLDLKNQYSSDNKYLATTTENGLWIKDEIKNKINIINANKVDNQFLLDVQITELNKNFDVLKIIQSDKVDISSFEWKINKPTILNNNQEYILDELVLQSNFDLKKINSLFSNLSSLTIFKLIELRKSYKILNYSVVDIDSHLYRVISYPIYLTLITIFSSIIMFNIGYQKNTFYKIILGIFLSVIIYYINYFLNILGTNEKIPLILSIFMPLVMLTIINFTSIIKINEK